MDRYVAVLHLPDGTRLYCSDQYRDEWSARFVYAETFAALHEATRIAALHGGSAHPWRDLHALDAPSISA